MRRLLIVSPHFPPVSAPDMHRVRVSLPFFEECGWKPHVLTVRSEALEMPVDPLLVETVPPDATVVRTGATPARWTRALGFSSVGFRAFVPLYRAGARLIREHGIDLVYFSTTVFPLMILGRLWKARFGVPYVLDLQDPWSTGAFVSGQPGIKARLAMTMHGWLEPFAMRDTAGLIVVSPDYASALRARYANIQADRCVTLPFAASENDFSTARRQPNRFFRAGAGAIHGVYVGRVNEDMQTAARVLVRAVARLRHSSDVAGRVKLIFVGTDYARPGHEQKMVEPLAAQEGLGDAMVESPARVPHFEGLRLLTDSDFLVLLGSDDVRYSPSKLMPSLLAHRPIVAIVREGSEAADLVRRPRAGVVVTYDPTNLAPAVDELIGALAPLLARLPFEPDTDWAVVAPFGARALTRRQCDLFDRIAQANGVRQAS